MSESLKRDTRPPRTVLFIAYHYPPIASGGVERTLKFARYLPDFGYRAQVLTTGAFGKTAENDGALRAWEPLQLYRRLFDRQAAGSAGPSSARRTRSPLAGLVARLRPWFFVPDGQITWIPGALFTALRFARRSEVDLIYTSSPPASAHLLGRLLKQYTDLPWVADFRDSWVYDPLDPEVNHMPYRRELERRMEEAVLADADAVIAATDISADYLRSTYGEAKDRIHVITNGFDPGPGYTTGEGSSHASPLDSVSAPAVPAATAGDELPDPAEPMVFLHTGSFSTSHPQRSPQPLFTALEALLAEDPHWAARIRVELVGHLTSGERDAAAALQKAGIVLLRGQVERAEALEWQRRAHALLLVDHPRDWPASNLPGKFFEYAATAKPILALCDEGMVAEMIARLRAGMRVAARDETGIRRCLKQMYEEHRAGSAHGALAADLLPFHRRELTRSLAARFDTVLPSR